MSPLRVNSRFSQSSSYEQRVPLVGGGDGPYFDAQSMPIAEAFDTPGYGSMNY